MSQANVDLVQKAIEAATGRDPAVYELFSDDVEFAEASALPDSGVQRGVDAMLEATARFEEAFEEIAYEPYRYTEAGDHVLVDVRYRGRARHTDLTLDAEAQWLYTIREGKVVGIHIFTNRGEALEAASLSG
jgi:ketosteroid isomerase-like protein